MEEEQVWLTKTEVARRYGKDHSTIWRWTAKGLIPKPKYIAGVRHWHLPTLLEYEAQLPETLDEAKTVRKKLKEAAQ